MSTAKCLESQEAHKNPPVKNLLTCGDIMPYSSDGYPSIFDPVSLFISNDAFNASVGLTNNTRQIPEIFPNKH